MTHSEAKSSNIWQRHEAYDKRGKSSFNYAKSEWDSWNLLPDEQPTCLCVFQSHIEKNLYLNQKQIYFSNLVKKCMIGLLSHFRSYLSQMLMDFASIWLISKLSQDVTRTLALRPRSRSWGQDRDRGPSSRPWTRYLWSCQEAHFPTGSGLRPEEWFLFLNFY